jgi:hypothetical protein
MKILVFILTIPFSSFAFGQNATESILKGNKLYQQSQFDLAEAQYRMKRPDIILPMPCRGKTNMMKPQNCLKA